MPGISDIVKIIDPPTNDGALKPWKSKNGKQKGENFSRGPPQLGFVVIFNELYTNDKLIVERNLERLESMKSWNRATKSTGSQPQAFNVENKILGKQVCVDERRLSEH